MIAENQMPPCVRRLRSLLANGEAVSHDGRFAFATFALTAGIPPEGVAQAFTRTPNYNEEKTRKQVQGLVDGAYTPPNCATMKQKGLCDKSMEVSLCAHIKNPISFYRTRTNDSSLSRLAEPAPQIPLGLWVYECRCGERSRPLPGPTAIQQVANMHLMSVPDDDIKGHEVRYLEALKL